MCAVGGVEPSASLPLLVPLSNIKVEVAKSKVSDFISIDDDKFDLGSSGDPASVWLDYYEGGWQTVLPHGGYPSNYYGADFGLHGDVNNMPWDTRIISDTPDYCEVEFYGRSIRSPFEIKRTITLKSDESFIGIKQEVKNFGEEDLDIVWLEHIAIGGSFLSDKCVSN